MPTVYLVQEPRQKNRASPINLDPARKFGTIKSLLHEDVKASQNPLLVLGEIEKGLKNFDHWNDYILWAIGDPLAPLMVGIALAKLSIPHFMWLRFSKHIDRSKGQPTGEFTYIPEKIPVVF